MKTCHILAIKRRIHSYDKIDQEVSGDSRGYFIELEESKVYPSSLKFKRSVLQEVAIAIAISLVKDG